MDIDIVGMFKKGFTKDNLIKHVFFLNKSEDKKFTKIEAKRIVEEELLKDALRNKGS